MKKMLKIKMLLILFLILLTGVSLAGWILFVPEIDCPPNTNLIVYRGDYFMKTSEHCEDSSGLFHGPSIDWYAFGQKSEIANYYHGEKDGKWILMNKDGSKSMEIEYNKGLKHGRERRWWKNGQLMIEMIYKNGKMVDSIPATPDGMRWACWGEDGNIIECPW